MASFRLAPVLVHVRSPSGMRIPSYAHHQGGGLPGIVPKEDGSHHLVFVAGQVPELATRAGFDVTLPFFMPSR